MTREEAIELLEDLDGAIEDNHGRDYDEAFHMAIEALQKDIERHEMVIRASERHLGLVRCKDCKSSRVYGKTTQWLACEDVMEGQATDPNGYCYLGERKGGDEL